MAKSNSPIVPVPADPIWQERWHEQCQYLDKLATYYAGNLAVPRIPTLHALVKCLKAFAQKQVDFFQAGFSQGKLAECGEFPPEAVFAAIIDQIGFDISIIERAAEQRIRCYQQETASPGDPLHRALAIGDHLAYEALQVAQTAKLLRETTTVLTYLHKSPIVRVIPYAPVVLVGIPHTCIGINRDFLAIPHEIGHYVYRHGRFQQNEQTIQGKFPVAVLPSGLNTWVKTWFEEIFADVYGALVAGPVIGLDFQDLQMTSKVTSFHTDDGDHPVPMLRPHIYNNVINRSASGWANKLDINWQTNLQARDKFLPTELKDQTTGKTKRKFKRQNGQGFDVETAISTSSTAVPATPTKPLDIAIDSILSQLLTNAQAQSWPANLASPETGETAQDLYTKFDGFIATLQLREDIPDLSLAANQTIKVGNDATQRQAGETLFPNRVDQTRDTLANVEYIGCQEWLRVLAAAGWATRGPNCEGTTGVC